MCLPTGSPYEESDQSLTEILANLDSDISTLSHDLALATASAATNTALYNYAKTGSTQAMVHMGIYECEECAAKLEVFLQNHDPGLGELERLRGGLFEMEQLVS